MVERQALLGHWVHSHEEDTEDLKVFRRDDFGFPPSRGREGFELKPDGTCFARSPGPTDVPEEAPGTWELEGETLRLSAGTEAHHKRSLRVIAAEPEKLLVSEQGIG